MGRCASSGQQAAITLNHGVSGIRRLTERQKPVHMKKITDTKHRSLRVFCLSKSECCVGQPLAPSILT